jgi:hypothetical protein
MWYTAITLNRQNFSISMAVRMDASETLVSLGNEQSDFFDSVQVLFGCLGEFLGSPYALVDVSCFQQLTQFHATFYTTVTHGLLSRGDFGHCQQNLQTHLYEDFFLLMYFSTSNTHCSILYHYGSAQTQ